MGLPDRDYMRGRSVTENRNPFLAWWHRSSITEILGTGILVLSLASAAVWLLRDISLSTASREGTLRVNVNTATIEELETLPGIGPSLAGLIVAGRPYESVDDLERIKGIGPATVESLRLYVRTSGETETLR